jgi:hypothetical protein
MAGLGTIMTVASAGATLAGAFMAKRGADVQAEGALEAGRAQQAAAQWEAQQLEVRAREEKAQAYAEAQDLSRKKVLALSTLQAAAAASGFMADSESTLDVAGEIAEYGTLQEQMAQYGGNSRQNALRNAAEGRRMTGAAQAKGSEYAAAGYRNKGNASLLGGVSSMAGQFGNFMPGNTYRYIPTNAG